MIGLKQLFRFGSQHCDFAKPAPARLPGVMNRINTEAVGTKKLNTAGLTVDFTRRASNRAMLNGQIRPHRGMARRPRVEIEDGKALLPYDLALHLLIGQKADSKCFRDNYAKCDKPDNYAKWYTRQPEN